MLQSVAIGTGTRTAFWFSKTQQTFRTLLDLGRTKVSKRLCVCVCVNTRQNFSIGLFEYFLLTQWSQIEVQSQGTIG